METVFLTASRKSSHRRSPMITRHSCVICVKGVDGRVAAAGGPPIGADLNQQKKKDFLHELPQGDRAPACGLE